MVRYDLPGRRISNAFCGICGSRLPYVSLSGKALVVPAGTLDQCPSKPPTANIFWPERAQWYDQAIVAPSFNSYADE